LAADKAAEAGAAAVEPVVDTHMVRQLSMSRSQRFQSQRGLSQRGLSQRRVRAPGGGEDRGSQDDASQRHMAHSQVGEGGGREGASQTSEGGLDATPLSQEVMDVFAWMQAEDVQDQGVQGGGSGQEDDEEEEEEAYDPLQERVREMQMDAELRHAQDILESTQVVVSQHSALSQQNAHTNAPLPHTFAVPHAEMPQRERSQAPVRRPGAEGKDIDDDKGQKVVGLANNEMEEGGGGDGRACDKEGGRLEHGSQEGAAECCYSQAAATGRCYSQVAADGIHVGEAVEVAHRHVNEAVEVAHRHVEVAHRHVNEVAHRHVNQLDVDMFVAFSQVELSSL